MKMGRVVEAGRHRPGARRPATPLHPAARRARQPRRRMTWKTTRILELEGSRQEITLHVLDSSEIEPFRTSASTSTKASSSASSGPAAPASPRSSRPSTAPTCRPPAAPATARRRRSRRPRHGARPPGALQLRRREIGFVSQFLKVEPRVLGARSRRRSAAATRRRPRRVDGEGARPSRAPRPAGEALGVLPHVVLAAASSSA